MTTVEYDLHYLTTALDHLETYLLSPAPRWPLEKHGFNNEPAFPPLTVENFLLARQRLSKWTMTSTNRSEFEKLEASFQDFLKRWRANWGKKALHGFQHRLNLWLQYMAELGRDLPAHLDRYPYEVRMRVMLTLLLPYADTLPSQDLNRLNIGDQKLRTFFAAGTFVWPVELQESFPQTPFWYLYGSPDPSRSYIL